MNHSKILTRLKEGNQRFIQDRLDGKLQDSKRRESLTGGQEPYAIVLSCADSRVVPEIIFDTGLGELFVLRVAGNIANTDTVASIEYAVSHCGSKVIVVLGHENCGAVTAAIDGGDNGYNLNHLLAQITPAVEGCDTNEVNAVVKQNAKNVAKDLSTRSEIISKALAKKDIEIVPAYYSLSSGEVNFLE